MTLPDTKVEVAVAATAAAKVDGNFHSFEQGLLILCITGLIVFITSVWLSIHVQSIWTDIGAALGLGIIGASVCVWIFKGKGTRDQRPPSSITVSEGSQVISASNLNPDEAILALKNVIQNRQALPVPHGKFYYSDDNQIEQAYSKPEKQQFLAEQKNQVIDHDKKILEELNVLSKSLEL